MGFFFTGQEGCPPRAGQHPQEEGPQAGHLPPTQDPEDPQEAQIPPQERSGQGQVCLRLLLHLFPRNLHQRPKKSVPEADETVLSYL